jgi:hypothetical protein
MHSVAHYGRAGQFENEAVDSTGVRSGNLLSEAGNTMASSQALPRRLVQQDGFACNLSGQLLLPWVMKTSMRLMACTVVFAAALLRARADTPTTVVTGPNVVIGGFELKDNGLYYWTPPVSSGPGRSGPHLAGIVKAGQILDHSTIAGGRSSNETARH